MALRINHNITALDAWRNLTNTTRKMGVTMEKLSSGFRVNRAADDPAGLVISEQFRAQIAGLNRAVQNSEGSINMIQTAEGALNEINNLLVSMRELAIHAANEGFNDVNQLAADQAEITNAIRTINRIAANTQFGTKKLLDGSAANVAAITTANISGLTLTDSQLSAGAHSITAVKLTESTATMNTTSFGLSNPTGPYNLSEGVHNLDIIQASSGAIKTGNAISALDAWGNGLHFDSSTDTELRNARISDTIDFNIDHGITLPAAFTITFQINYQEMGNNPVGMQTLTIRTSTLATTDDLLEEIATKLNDAINANSFLAGKVQASVINAAGNESDYLTIKSTGKGTQYSIATGSITASDDNLADLLQVYANLDARGISGSQMKITAQFSSSNITDVVTRTITFDLGTGVFTSLSALVATINGKLTDSGATGFGVFEAAAGSRAKVIATVVNAGGLNYLKFYTSDEGSKYSIKFETTGGTATSAYTALGLTVDSIANRGLDAIVRFDGYSNVIDDVRFYFTAGFDNSVTLYTSDDINSRGSITLDKAMAYENGGLLVGNMLLTVKARTFAVQLDGGPPTVVTAGQYMTIFNAQRDQSIMVHYSLKSEGGTEQLFVTDRSLVFQIGANVGQTAKISLDNLAADYLGRNVPNSRFASLAEIDVMTAAGAQDAQRVIDQAITEVTNIRGKLGSFQKNTLESNLTNLRIAAQNLTASESSIRDTDMAREMSEFVKAQILLQAGTAMLAQGNQIPQVVLSLFR